MNVWMPVNAADEDSTPDTCGTTYIDFGDCFGSQWDWDGISRRLGHATTWTSPTSPRTSSPSACSGGPGIRLASTPGSRFFRYFSARDFAPEVWRGGYPNPAFAEMTERDGAWAARIIARFSREHLRRIVQAGNSRSSSTRPSCSRP